MLILFGGKSRDVCKFLHGPPNPAWQGEFAHFETFSATPAQEKAAADSDIAVAQSCASLRLAGGAKAPVPTYVFRALCVDISCCGR
jgi:hypothetical protein